MLHALLGLALAAEPLSGGFRVPSVSPESTVGTYGVLAVDGQGGWVQQGAVQGRAVVKNVVGFSVEMHGATAPLDELRAWPGRLILGLDGFHAGKEGQPKLTAGFEFGFTPAPNPAGAWADRARDTTAGRHGALRFVLATGPDERVLIRWAVGLYSDPYRVIYAYIALKPILDLTVLYTATVSDGLAVLTEAELLNDFSPFHLRVGLRAGVTEGFSLDAGGHFFASTAGGLAAGPLVQMTGSF